MRIVITESQLKNIQNTLNRQKQKTSITIKRFKDIVNEDQVKDIPTKADFVKDDLTDFYKTLEDAAKSGGLSQQSRGGMVYQKAVESMQIGLMLLGYDLPKHGVDGLFGPETATAVSKFSKENVKEESKEKRSFLNRLFNINEVNVSLGSFKGDLENGPSNHASRGFGNWESDNAWDLFAPVGTPVNSYTKGVVSKVKESSGRNPKIYGTQISIKGEDGYPNIFYTHIENVKLSKGDVVDVGDFIGTVKESPGNTETHVHIGLPYGSHIKDLLVNSDLIFKGSGVLTPVEHRDDDDVSNGKVSATPKMLTKLIEMLKTKNITAKDIKPLTDKYAITSDQAITGDIIIKGGFDGVQRKNISLVIDEMKKNNITNPYVQIGILSVMAKESGFKTFSESSYATTSNQRIRNIFGKRVAQYSDEELNQLKKDPKAFFNVVYAKTVGNQGGDDGWMYRGRGFNGLTGIKNYERFGRLAGMGDELVRNPELLNDPKIAAKVAIVYFTKGKPASTIPNFDNKEDATKYFADINSGSGAASHRVRALAASEKFDVKSNLA